MPLDYSWSYDPIFPAAVFEDPKVGPLLAKVGIEFNHRGNQVPAFHSPKTAIAMLAAPEPIIKAMISTGVSLAPHSGLRSGDEIGGRTEFVLKELRKVVGKHEAGEVTDDEAKNATFHLHMFLTQNVVRRIVVDPETKELGPDPELVAAVPQGSTVDFDATACMDALEAGPTELPHPTKTPPPLPGGITLTATVLLDDAKDCAAVKDRVAAEPDLLEGFEIGEFSEGSFMANKGDTTLVAMAVDAPYPAADLKSFCTDNALATDIWDVASETKGHVHLQLMRKAAEAASRDDAMLLARAAASIGGSVVIWGAASAAMPAATFSQAVAASHEDGSWPTLAMLRMQLYKDDERSGAALVGLSPFTGYDIALAADADQSLNEVAGRAIGLAGWIFDTRPRFADGDTMGVEGTNAAQLRVHEHKSPDGIPTFEFRPYDGPSAAHTPEEREAVMAKEDESGRVQAEADPGQKPRKRPFWKFWGK